MHRSLQRRIVPELCASHVLRTRRVVILAAAFCLAGTRLGDVRTFLLAGKSRNQCGLALRPDALLEVVPRVVQRGDGAGSKAISHVSESRFDGLPVSAETKKAIKEGFGYEHMTEVQAQTVGPLLGGADMLARAKTGTGKTLGFLIPTVERIKGPLPPGAPKDAIRALIISPSRELASQILKEATKLVSFHQGLGAKCVFGGVGLGKDQRDLKDGPCSILVATPGRLKQHMAETPGFANRLGHLEVVILDEADQLLDMGFRGEILKILEKLPPASARQGLLFSATFPKAVSDIAGLALKPGYQYIDTVNENEESTPQHIAQSYAVASLEGMNSLIWASVNQAKDRDPSSFKLILFFATARLTQYYADVFRQTELGSHVFEIHSKKAQSFRTTESERFRKATQGILFSSDVSARGLDYPGVTNVIQVGAASSREQYIHRLGRTGRGGNQGSGMLLLYDIEEYFLRDLSDMPLQKYSIRDLSPSRELDRDPTDTNLKSKAYAAWLGYYKSNLKSMKINTRELVSLGTRFAKSIGALDAQGLPPPLDKMLVGKMGLKGVPGLNVVAVRPK